MVEHQPSKLDTWVRFPSPALLFCRKKGNLRKYLLTFTSIYDSILKYRFGVVRAPEKNGSGSVPAKATEYVSVAQLDRATAF